MFDPYSIDDAMKYFLPVIAKPIDYFYYVIVNSKRRKSN